MPSIRLFHVVGSLILASLGTTQPLKSALRIEVIAGEGTNNHGTRGTGVSAAVRISDGGNPVPDVLVVFAAPNSGPSLDFVGMGATASAITSESGTAVSPHSKPVGGNGPLELRVMATRKGETVNAIIHQMNVGVGGGSDPSREIYLHPSPSSSQEDGQRRQVHVRVKVEDGNGKPVPGARVSFSLTNQNWEKTSPSGGAVTTADEDGVAGVTLLRPGAKAKIRLTAQAESDGRKSTEFLQLP